MEVDDSGNYKLGTELGALSQMYVRSQFEPAVEKFNVPNQTISLREAARGSSIGLGQGFLNAPVQQVVVANAANVSKQQKSAIVGAIAVMLVKINKWKCYYFQNKSILLPCYIDIFTFIHACLPVFMHAILRQS